MEDESSVGLIERSRSQSPDIIRKSSSTKKMQGFGTWMINQQQHQKVWLPYLSLCLVHSIFAGWNILGRAVLSTKEGLSPVVFSLVREVISSILLIILAKFSDWKAAAIPQRKDLWAVVLVGTTGTFLNQIGFIYGLKYTNAMTAAIFQPLLPVFTTLFSSIMNHTRASREKIIGLVLAVIGSLVIIISAGILNHHQTAEDGHEDHDHFSSVLLYGFGFFMLCVNIIAFSYSLITQRRLLETYSSKWVTAWGYSIGCVEMFIAALLIDGPTHLAGRFPLDSDILMVLLYVILLTTVLNYSLLTWANKKTSSETVAVFFCVNPFVTSILAYWFLNEVLTIWHLLGGILLIWGLQKFNSSSSASSS
jgi:drug/metabolite transporter (DMT)-like permease